MLLSVGSSRGSNQAGGGNRRIRELLLGTTALIGAAAVAAPAHAQSARPAGGGTIEGPGTYSDQTASGGGVSYDTTGTLTITNVQIDNTTGNPTADALRVTAVSGSAVLRNYGSTRLSTTVPGGAALSLTSRTGNISWGISQYDLNATVDLVGPYGIRATAPQGFVHFVDFGNGAGGLRSITGDGTGVAGIFASALGGVDISLQAPIISGFDTGVAIDGATARFATTGGSITATTIGVNASATGSAAVQTGAAISARTGISAASSGDWVLVATAPGGTIDSDVAGMGTGIDARATGGSGQITVSIGAAIGEKVMFASGVRADHTGTGRTRVTTSASVSGTDVGIYARSAATMANAVNVYGGIVSGRTAVHTMGPGFTTTIAHGATVTGTGIDNRGYLAQGGTARLHNHGTINTVGTALAGAQFDADGFVVNSGAISGGTGIGVWANSGLTLTNSGLINGVRGIYVGGNSAVTITNNIGGSISGIEEAIRSLSSVNTILNSGAITAGSGAGNAITFGGGSIVNHGTITYSGGAISTPGNGIQVNGSGADITNLAGASIIGRWVGVQALRRMVTTNSGLIRGDRFAGIEVNSIAPAMITNNDGGRIYGASAEGAGLRMTMGSAQVVNHAGGVIVGAGAAGIWNRDGGTLDVVNAGTIGAGTLDGANNYVNGGDGAGIVSRAGTVNNATGGSVLGGSGAGMIFSSHSTLNNYGTVDSGSGIGIASIGNAGIRASLHAGSTTGAVVGGDGSDILTIYNGRGTAGAALTDPTSGITLQNAGTLAGAIVGPIDLGGGNNWIILGGTGDGTAANGAAGSFALDSAYNVQALGKFDSGTWRLTGLATTPAMTIFAGSGTPSGMLVFDGTSNLTGTITANGTTIRAESAGAFGSGMITMINPIVQYGATGIYSNDISIGTSTLLAPPSRIQVDAGVVATLTGTISATRGARSLVYNGLGTAILTGEQAYTAGTIVASGRVVHQDQGGATGTTSIWSGATLGFDVTDPASSVLVAGGATFEGSGSLVKEGEGRLSFGGDGFVTVAMARGGLIDVQAGTLSGGSNFEADWTDNQASLNVAAGATFEGVEAHVRVDALTGAGLVRGGYFGGGSTTIGVADGSGTFDGVIADQDASTGSLLSLIKAGSGTQTLTGVNSYSGATIVDGGTLALAGNGSIANSSVTVNDGGTFSIAGLTNGGTSIVHLGGTGFVDLGANTLTLSDANGTFGGILSGSGGVIKDGSGTWTLTGQNSFLGDMVVAGGTLLYGGDDILSDAVTLRIGTGATVDLAGYSGTIALLSLEGGTLVNGGRLTATGYLLHGGTIGQSLGAGALVQQSGTTFLNGTSDAGTVNIAGGTLQIGASERLADTAALTVGAGATLALQGFNETVGTATIGGTLAGSGTLTASTYNLIGGTIDANLGTGTLVQAGGTSVLNGVSAATLVGINGGTLRLGASERLADLSQLTIGTGGTLDLQGFDERVGSVTIAGVLDGSGTLSAADYRLAGGIVNANLGAGALDQQSGTSLLNGTSAASTVLASGGTLRLGADERLADGAALVVAAGATVDLQGFSETVGTALLRGRLAGTGTLSAANYTLDGAVVNANLGTGALVVAGGGNLLGGTSGADSVDIRGGTLELGAGERLADGARVTVADGATLDLQSFSETVGQLDLAGTLAGSGTLTAADYVLVGGTADANLGAGILTQLSGLSTLNGTAAAGLVDVRAGTLRLGASDRLNDTAAVSVADGATLDLGANSDVVGLLALDGVLAGTGTLTAGQYRLAGATVNADLGVGALFHLGGVSMLNGTAGASLVAVQSGTLRLGASERLADSATVAVAGGATLDLQSFDETVDLLDLAGTLAGTGTLTAAQYQLAGATVDANLGAGTLLHLGGVSMLNGTAGASLVAVRSGTLRLGASERLADSAAVAVGGGATLDLQSFDETVDLLHLAGTLAGTGTLTAAQYQLDGAIVDANLGAGVLLQLGGASLLNGAAGAGQILVNGGVLRLGGDERIADSATVVIADGATLDLGGSTETIGTLFGGSDEPGVLALNGGRLIVGGTSADFGFGGAITGDGSIDKIGTGRFTLAGDFATTGAINVLGGSMAFAGTTAGSLAVNGGMLIGSGLIGQSLTLTSGTLSPGGLGSDPASAFGGFQAASFIGTGGTFAVGFGGAGTGYASDFLSITGAATLSGVAFAPTAASASSDYRFMQRYAVLQADSLTGTFANGANFSAVTNDSSLNWRLRYDLLTDGVVLEIQRALDFSAGVIGGSANAAAVGSALNGAAGRASDEWGATLNALAAVPAGQRTATYESLSGEPIANLGTAMLFSADQFAQLLRRRGARGTGGIGSGLPGPLAMNVTGSSSAATRQLAAITGGMHVASDASPAPLGSSGGNRFGLWAEGFGGRQQIEGEAGLADVETSSAGIAGGFELLSGNATFGLAGGYSSIDNDAAARGGNSNGDVRHLGLYAGYDNGRTYANAQAGYFAGDFRSSRLIVIGGGEPMAARGEASFDGYAVGASIGHRLELGRDTRLALEAGAQRTHVERDAFTETAAGGLGLAVSAEERDLLTISGDVRISRSARLGSSEIEPYAQLGIRWNSGDLDAQSGVRFSGAPTGLGGFTTQGAGLDDVAGVIGGGFEIRANDNLRVGFDMQALFGERTRETQFGLHARLAF